MQSITDGEGPVPWNPECRVLATADFIGDTVRIKNIRNFSYTGKGGAIVEKYYDKTFSLSGLTDISYAVSPFSRVKGVAHTFISFGFSSGEFISISIEIRKHVGEEYSFVRSITHPFPLIYIIGNEHDLLTLRAIHREETVYLYPGKASEQAIQKLFLGMLRGANTIHTQTEYYNLFFNTCTTKIARHINEINPLPIVSLWDVVMPDYTDIVAQRMGFLAVPERLPAGREKYRINGRAVRYANDSNFSLRIRNKVDAKTS